MQDTNPSVTTTCPACGLLCDDITIDKDTGKTTTPCSKAVNFYQQAFNLKQLTPQIADNDVSLEEAIAESAKILSNSQQPLFAGLGTEVFGMRALTTLAKKANATLDHMHSEGTVNNTLTLQNIGYQTTTLMEVKNRADVILVIGADLEQSVPNFLNKMVWNNETLFDKPKPKVIYLAPPESAKANKKIDVVPAEHQAIPEISNTLKALLNDKNPLNRLPDDTNIAGVPLSALKSILEQLKSAQYGVVIWSASNLKTLNQAELVTQTIVQFINQLNESNRVMGLPLNSGDGDTSVNNTFTWLTGYPTRTKFVNGKAIYDARNYSTNKQIIEADSLMWTSTFNPVAPPETKVPTIVIGHPNTQMKQTPDVFIPVAVPGVHSNGSMFRMDSSITLPLKTVNENALPTLANVIEQIESKLA